MRDTFKHAKGQATLTKMINNHCVLISNKSGHDRSHVRGKAAEEKGNSLRIVVLQMKEDILIFIHKNIKNFERIRDD